MALSFGKRDCQKMAATLDHEYADWGKEIKSLKAKIKSGDENVAELEERLEELVTLQAQVEDFARMALEEAQAIIQSKAAFTVVGQVKWRKGEPPGDKIALDWYSTERQALDDALKLTYSAQTHEEHLVWVLPVWHDTPHSYYQERKANKKADEASDASFREQELQRRIEWVEQHPGEPLPKGWGVFVPFVSELEDCWLCNGVGKVKREEKAA